MRARSSALVSLLPALAAALLFGCADPETIREPGAEVNRRAARELDALALHLDEMITLAEGIHDVAAARRAAPRMMQLVQELRAMEERIELLSSDEVYEANRARFQSAGTKLRQFREVMARIAADELMDPELSEAWLLFLTRA